MYANKNTNMHMHICSSVKQVHQANTSTHKRTVESDYTQRTVESDYTQKDG
jgi:hypothetical protein